jgi:hypothetical protein
LGVPKFEFDAAECRLKLLLFEFGVDVLDVFDAGEVVTAGRFCGGSRVSMRIASKAATMDAGVGVSGSSVSLPASDTPEKPNHEKRFQRPESRSRVCS